MRNRRPFRLSDGLRPSTLDRASRRTLAFFALKLGVILGFATLGAALDVHPALRFCVVVQALAFLTGTFAVVMAYLSGEVLLRGRTLNWWDEALGFAALGLLAKIGTRLFGS